MDSEHFGPDCPQCKSMTDQATTQGIFVEGLQNLLDDGFFFKLGYNMAYEREKAIWEAFFGKSLDWV